VHKHSDKHTNDIFIDILYKILKKFTDVNNIKIVCETEQNKLIYYFNDNSTAMNVNELFNNTLSLEKYNNNKL